MFEDSERLVNVNSFKNINGANKIKTNNLKKMRIPENRLFFYPRLHIFRKLYHSYIYCMHKFINKLLALLDDYFEVIFSDFQTLMKGIS